MRAFEMVMAVVGLCWLGLGEPIAAAADPCATTGEPAPAVVTLMASKTNPVSDAWIVQPNCNIEVVDAANTWLSIYDKGIEYVASVPTNMATINLDKNPLSHGANFSAASRLQGLALARFSLEVLDNLVIPNSVLSVSLVYTPLTSIDNVKLPDSLQSLDLTGSSIESIDRVKLPDSLQTLNLESPMLTSIDRVKLPDGLQTLELHNTALTSIDNITFPPELVKLIVQSQSLTSLKKVKFPTRLKWLELETNSSYVDVVLPPRLDRCSLSGGSDPILERISLPSTLTFFDWWTSKTPAIVRGIKWPTGLVQAYFGVYAQFEIRQSDVGIFDAMKFDRFRPTDYDVACEDLNATLTVVNFFREWKVCVISDERFETLYGIPTIAPSITPSTSVEGSDVSDDEADGDEPTKAPIESRGSASSRSEDVGDEDTIVVPGARKKTKKPSSRTASPGRPIASGSAVSGSGSSETPGASNKPRSTRQSNSTTTGTKSAFDSTTPGASDESTEIINVKAPLGKALVITVIVAGIVFVVLVIGFALRVFIFSRSCRDDEKDHYDSLDTPTMSTALFSSSDDQSTVSSWALAPNDVRNDQLLLVYRVHHEDVELKKALGRQGFSMMFEGVHKGQSVAVRRIQPEFSQDASAVDAFMAEIRMCASVDHPKIVALVGISWSSKHDLSAIVELMAGGDLETLLHCQPQPANPHDWSAPWTASKINSKTSIALDVAQALAYLHGFNTPIHHRDLRARHVRLDNEGNAKLDTFAINRNATVDETMRGESGSVAWIAPELLLGDQETEKADIYALGVLLVELDVCRPPYEASSTSNIQIAVQVSSGQLRPRVYPTCPDAVALLVAKCLAFDAASRPSAQQVVAELSQLQFGV